MLIKTIGPRNVSLNSTFFVRIDGNQEKKKKQQGKNKERQRKRKKKKEKERKRKKKKEKEKNTIHDLPGFGGGVPYFEKF